MAIYLGNLTVQQMESRMGILLTDQERKTLEDMRQENVAKDMEPGKFHIFDIPQVIACGSKETALKIKDILVPYSEKITGTWTIVQVSGR